jgi:acyl carrier protein
MNREPVRSLVLKYIAAAVEGLPVSKIESARSLKDYGVNSLDMVEIVSRSMRELKVKVPRAELRKLTNIDGLIDMLHQAVLAAEKPAGAAPDGAAGLPALR